MEILPFVIRSAQLFLYCKLWLDHLMTAGLWDQVFKLNLKWAHILKSNRADQLNPLYRWWLKILPQYLANLTQPIGTEEAILVAKFVLILTNIVYARCKVFELFCAFWGISYAKNYE